MASRCIKIGISRKITAYLHHPSCEYVVVNVVNVGYIKNKVSAHIEQIIVVLHGDTAATAGIIRITSAVC